MRSYLNENTIVLTRPEVSRTVSATGRLPRIPATKLASLVPCVVCVKTRHKSISGLPDPDGQAAHKNECSLSRKLFRLGVWRVWLMDSPPTEDGRLVQERVFWLEFTMVGEGVICPSREVFTTGEIPVIFPVIWICNGGFDTPDAW